MLHSRGKGCPDENFTGWKGSKCWWESNLLIEKIIFWMDMFPGNERTVVQRTWQNVILTLPLSAKLNFANLHYSITKFHIFINFEYCPNDRNISLKFKFLKSFSFWAPYIVSEWNYMILYEIWGPTVKRLEEQAALISLIFFSDNKKEIWQNCSVLPWGFHQSKFLLQYK